ncbi:Hypothetical predicted protein, partial [Lecanosticta acicola]
MPITWNSENEAKLLAAIFQVCNVQVTEPQKAEAARIMGQGCTAKAISHRIQKIKKGANLDGSGSGGGDVGTPIPAAKRVKTGKGKKAAASIPRVDDDDDDDEEEEEMFGGASGNPKGKKRSAGGRVKSEPREDDDYGIRVGED